MTIKKGKKAPSKADQMRAIRESNAKGKPGDAAVDKKELIVSDKTPVDVLPPLTDTEKAHKAVIDDKRFRDLETQTRTSFVEMMFILREFKAYGLHAFLKNKQGKNFGSFDSWLKEAAPLSRASGYAALRAAEKLLPIIPKKDLEAMPRFSVELLAKLPAGKLKLEPIITAAKTQSKKDLTKTVQKHAPEAHVEQKRTIHVDVSAGSVLDQAVQAAVLLGEVPENEAWEFIATSWLDAPCELEQYQGMTNRQAYNAATQAKNAEATGAELKEGQDQPGEAA